MTSIPRSLKKYITPLARKNGYSEDLQCVFGRLGIMIFDMKNEIIVVLTNDKETAYETILNAIKEGQRMPALEDDESSEPSDADMSSEHSEMSSDDEELNHYARNIMERNYLGDRIEWPPALEKENEFIPIQPLDEDDTIHNFLIRNQNHGMRPRNYGH